MQIKKLVFTVFALLSLAGCGMTSPGMYEELQQGKHTFAAGDYATAFHQLLPVAINGNKEAQYAVGYMYYNGLGVATDTETGVDWMKKSAQQGYAPAENALKDLGTH
jgi:TPR repeat protein